MIDIHVYADFHRYLKGGCHSGGGEAPKNVRKNDDFYRADFSALYKPSLSEDSGTKNE
jgi:hypothetical protein